MAQKIDSKLKKLFQERTSHHKLTIDVSTGLLYSMDVCLFIYLLSFYGLVLQFIFGHLKGKINMVIMVSLYHWAQGAKQDTMT